MKRVSFHFATQYTNRRRDLSPRRELPIRDMPKVNPRDFSRNRSIFGRRPCALALGTLTFQS